MTESWQPDRISTIMAGRNLFWPRSAFEQMFSKLFRSHSDSVLHKEFAREMLRAERQRVTLLAIALTAFLVLNIIS
jgi:hypothetical protein